MPKDVRLVEGDQHFRSLFDNNPDFVLFQNEAGVILDANPAFLELIHTPKEQVVGRPLRDFLPPHKQALFQEKLEQAFRGEKVQFETSVRLRGAPEARVFSVMKVPFYLDGNIAGVHAVAKDVTDVVHSQEVIQQQARTLNTIFESITDAFFLLDKHWNFTFVNSEVERLLGLSRAQLLGRNIWAVFPSDVISTLHKQFQQANTGGGGVLHFEAFFEPRQLWLEVKAFPSAEGLSVYFSDVTDKVKAHEELYRQNKDLQQFGYIVSHNLRAPLSNMLGLVEMLHTLPRESPEYGEVLKHLRTSTQQLDTVLRDMNTILTIRDKTEVTRPEPVPVGEVLTQVQQNLEEVLEQCGGEFDFTTIPANLRVRGNRAYLYSIFFNLLSNSIKYRAADRPLRVAISATRSAASAEVRIEVADNGSGFDLQAAGHDIFKLYKRFHAQPSGRGLGLYLIKSHVDSMGGHIEVHSEVNIGTRFVLHLPE